VFYPFAFSAVCTDQLSDFEPKGAACAAFGVLHPGGFPERSDPAAGRTRPGRARLRPPGSAKLPTFGE
jgi:hypothetical protein